MAYGKKIGCFVTAICPLRATILIFLGMKR